MSASKFKSHHLLPKKKSDDADDEEDDIGSSENDEDENWDHPKENLCRAMVEANQLSHVVELEASSEEGKDNRKGEESKGIGSEEMNHCQLFLMMDEYVAATHFLDHRIQIND